MTKTELKVLLKDFRKGRISEKSLLNKLSALRFESMGFATIDHHRHLRQGFPEVIFCEGKTPVQVAEIAAKISRGGRPLLATRAGKAHFTAVKRKIPFTFKTVSSEFFR